MHITLRDASEDEFAGYHMIDGVPEAEVFTRGTDGELLADWHATLSHEVLADGGYIDAHVGGRLITVWGNPKRQKERRYRKTFRAQRGEP
jgi:hypothetical protein